MMINIKLTNNNKSKQYNYELHIYFTIIKKRKNKSNLKQS